MRKRQLAAIRCHHFRSIFKEVEIESVQEIPDFLRGCRKFSFRENAAQRCAVNVQCLPINRWQLREFLIRKPDDFVNAVPTLQLHPVVRRSREVYVLGGELFDDVCQFSRRNGNRAFLLNCPIHLDADAYLQVCRDTFDFSFLRLDEDV